MSATGDPAKTRTIYIVDASIAFTGAFACACNIAEALSETAEVVLVIPMQSSLRGRDIDAFSSVYRLPILPLRKNIISIALYIPALVVSSIWLRWLLLRDRSECLILNDFYIMQGAVCRALGFRGQILTWVRIDPLAFGRYISTVWIKFSAMASDQLIAVSEHIKQRFPKSIACKVVYDGWAGEPYSRAPNSPAASDRLLYVANFIPGKGQDHALEAFALVSHDFPDLSLHFFGGDMGLEKNRSFRDHLIRRCEDLELNNRVRFHEFLDDPTNVMNGALAALNFSDSESFSMTVLEAQGMGVPVIATDSGGPAEIIDDERTGILVPVRDINSMANAIRRLSGDRELAKEFGDAAKKRVAENFSFQAFKKRILSIVK